MKIIKQSYYFLVHTNLLIAVAAMAQCALTYFFFETAFDWPIIVIEGAATLLLYNFSLWLSKPKDPLKSSYMRTRWVFENEWVLWGNSILAFIALLLAIREIHLFSLFFLAGVGLLSVAYSFPLFPYNGKWVGLRQLPGVKIFHIALVWVLSSVCLPAYELYLDGWQPDQLKLVSLFGLKFIFLIICTLPFDIRDIKQDSYYHLKTIPNMIGAVKAIRLCYILLFVHSSTILLTPFSLRLKIGILITNIGVALLLKTVVFRNSERYHYAYLLDFALVVQFFTVAIAISLFS